MDHNVMPEPVAAPVSQRKRRRPALSCAECRRRKIKCDRNVPCGPCKQSKSATCTYSPEGLSARGNHVVRTATAPLATSTLLGERENPLNFVQGSGGLIHVDNDFANEQFSHDSSSPRSSCANTGLSDGGQDVQALIDRVQRLESLLATTSIGEGINTSRPLPRVKAKDMRGNLSKTRWFGQSHWIQAFVQARKIMCFEFDTGDTPDIKLKDKNEEAELNGLLHKCKSMARTIKAAQAPQWTLWGSSFKYEVPARETADILVDLYLRTHESNYRILHIPSFWKEYNSYWVSPESSKTSSSIKMLLVMAIGTCFYQGPDFEKIRSQARQWVYAAQSWLGAPNEKGRLHTSVIQVQCLLLLARSIYMIGGDLIWITSGSVLRTAIQMGFHRDPKNFPRISMLHGEVRRRLWATVLEINLQSSLDAGMMPLMSLNDFDTEPPSNINDEDISESTLIRPVSKPREIFTQTSIQLIILSSFADRLETCSLINDFRYEITYDEVLRLSASIIKTYKENNNYIAHAAEAPSTPGQIKPTSLHRKFLDLTTQRFLLALHRPFATKARADPRFYYSHKVYVDLALAVLSHPDRDFGSATPSDILAEPHDDYTRLRLVSGGFLKEVIMHAAVVTYLAMIVPLEQDPDLVFTKERETFRAPFCRLLEETIQFAAARIALGETNVKGHLMFSIVIAHIDALEKGESIEDAIIAAAKKSALFCCELLEKQMPKPEHVEDEMADGFLGGYWENGAGVQDVDFQMEDWRTIDFESKPDYWLFSGWSDGNSVL